MYKLTKNYYSGITKFYFDVTLKSIIKIGDLNNGKKNIMMKKIHRIVTVCFHFTVGNFTEL